MIYVIDSSDWERIEEAKDEFQKFVNEDELRDHPILVLANKCDLPNTMEISQITDSLRLHHLRNRKWFIQAISATNGNGLCEGFDWVLFLFYLINFLIFLI